MELAFLVAVEYIESGACYSVVDAEAERQSFNECRFPRAQVSFESENRVLRQFGGQRFRGANCLFARLSCKTGFKGFQNGHSQ